MHLALLKKLLPLAFLPLTLSFGSVCALADDADWTLGLYQAMDRDLVSVRCIVADANHANVLIDNVTDRTLHLRLPDAIIAAPIVAVPILGQLGQGQNPGQAAGGGNQPVGGGIQAGNAQPAGNGPGGLMRIPPGKMRKLSATTVCLEYGKPEPHPRVAYRLVRPEQWTDDPRVIDLCTRLGRGELSIATAQAAAWHLTDALPWERLAQLNREASIYRGPIKYFTRSELDDAKKFVWSATAVAAGSAIAWSSRQPLE